LTLQFPLASDEKIGKKRDFAKIKKGTPAQTSDIHTISELKKHRKKNSVQKSEKNAILQNLIFKQGTPDQTSDTHTITLVQKIIEHVNDVF